MKKLKKAYLHSQLKKNNKGEYARVFEWSQEDTEEYIITTELHKKPCKSLH